MSRRAVPTRTCVGCRSRAAKADLLRFVAVGTELGYRLLPDPTGRLPGRGAHLHFDPDCLIRAEQRRVFGRAFRLGPLVGALDPTPLRRYVDAHQRRSAGSDGITAQDRTALSAPTDRQHTAAEGRSRTR